MFQLNTTSKTLHCTSKQKGFDCFFSTFSLSDQAESSGFLEAVVQNKRAAHTVSSFPTYINSSTGEILQESFCRYGAHDILGFKYIILVASRTATKMTHAVHGIAQFFSWLWKLKDTFPTSSFLHFTPSPCTVQNPSKLRGIWFSLQHWDLPPAVGCYHSEVLHGGDCGTVLYQRQWSYLKLNHLTQLGSES